MIWTCWIFIFLPPFMFAIAEVSIIPVMYISTVGDNLTFYCSSASGDAIMASQWIVNSYSVADLNDTNVYAGFNLVIGIGTLKFSQVSLKYNSTSIQCIADLQDRRKVYSSVATLLVQGPLSAVGFLTITLQNYFTYLSWSTPFTLDVSATVTYCVEVVNSTSSLMLYSNCEVNMTAFSYRTPNGVECGGVVFRVTPLNSAGKGTPNNVTYSLVYIPPTAITKTNKIIPIVRNHPSGLDVLYMYEINMTAPVCNVYMILLDINTQVSEVVLEQEDITIAENTLIFTSEELILNTKYNVTIIASNVNGSGTSLIDVLSTHDIVDVNVELDTYSIYIDYAQNTRALGVLIIIVLIRNGSEEANFTRSVYLALDRESSLEYSLPSQLSSGWYIISAYDIEESGTVQDGIAYPAFSETHFIVGSQQSPYSESTRILNLCNILTSQELEVSIQCFFPPVTSSYQVVMQRNGINDLELITMLYVNSSHGHNPVMIQVREEGEYHIAAFPIHGDTGIVGANVTYSALLTLTRTKFNASTVAPSINTNTAMSYNIIIIGVTVGAFSGVIIIIIGVALTVQCGRRIIVKKKREVSSSPTVGSDLPNKVEQMYEEIGEVHKESFMYTRNIVYGVSSVANKESITTVHGASSVHNHQYEDIKLAAPDSSDQSGHVFQINQCSAYGVNN